MKKLIFILALAAVLLCSCQKPEPEYPTEGMEKAKNSAVFYLASSAYSKNGLTALLEQNGYSPEEAAYGVENCGADWYKQSALCAKELLEFSSFTEEALYGAKQNGY